MGDLQSGRFLVFRDAAFEEVLLLLDVHHLRQPRQGVLHARAQGGEADAFQASIRDVIDLEKELVHREADRVHRQAVADEILLELHRLRHRST